MSNVFENLFRKHEVMREAGTGSHWIDVTPVESSDVPCRVGTLDVKVHVCGLYSHVEQTIEVENPNTRDISAELAIPLPDDAVMCGYALDIDGCLVDGVVVPKEQARVVFETEQRKGADPGLVEAVRGNVYRTRVYPVPAEGKRTVRLKYVTPLVEGEGNAAALELPMPAVRLKRRDVRIDVEMLDAPAPIVLGIGDARPLEARGCWSVECEEYDVEPSAPIVVGLPELPESFVMLERDEAGEVWFSASERMPVGGPESAVRISSLTILWDASGSRANADHEQEFELLRRYCSADAVKSLTLVVFADRVHEVREFTSADELVEYAKTVRYDGGTNLGDVARELASLPATCKSVKQGGACVLFSDGMDTLDGEALSFPDGCDVLAVVSGHERDAEALRQACKGLAFTVALAPKDAVELAAAFDASNPLRYLDIRGEGIADACDVSIPGGSRRSAIGRMSEPVAKLSFGEGAASHELTADDAREGSVLAHAWAGKRVSLLSTRTSDNADELLSLGRRFGVVSPVTSLLVLESLDQWLEYDIEPPEMLVQMHAEWKRRKAGEMRHTSKREIEDRHRVDLAHRWADLMRWWERDFSAPPAPAPVGGYAPFCPSCGERASAGQRFCAMCGTSLAIVEEGVMDGNATTVRGVFSDDDTLPLPMAEAAPSPLRAMSRLASAVFDRGAGAARESGRRTAGPDAYAMGEEAGALECDAVFAEAMPSELGGTGSPAASVQVKAWMPDAPYLKALDEAFKTGIAKAREEYLSQRDEYRMSPSFFLDCAGWFMAHDDEDFGLRVLTNLAEMRIEDAALLRVMAWRLREAGQLDRALVALRRVVGLRGEDSQSYRDMALVLSELAREAHGDGDETAARRYAQEAGEFYRKVALTPWERRPMAVGLFAVEEYNVMRSWAEALDWKEPPELPSLGEDLEGVPACDLRITLAWDADETDVDIHVTEPSGEEAYYAHNLTYAGGRVSEDITDGYGPELYEIRKAQEGSYAIRAHYYASHQQTVFGPATCTLTVYTDWGRAGQRQQITSTRLDKEHEMVDVGVATYGGEPK